MAQPESHRQSSRKSRRSFPGDEDWSASNADPAPSRTYSAAYETAPSCSNADARPAALAQKLAKRGLRIGRTAVGKGVFTTKRFVDGSCIGEIEGTVIADDCYVSRYSFDIGDGMQLEPNYPFRFVNHSCEPNCAFENFSFPHQANSAPVQGTHRKLLLFSICDISVGEELTIDYNWPADFAIRCGCRAPGCRGWIVTLKELPQVRADGDAS